MGGVRRQTHWENAREQGLVAGANMTGKKRIRYEQVPYFWTEMFDLKMDFVGDFSLQPTRVTLKGAYAKKKFVVRYYQGDKLRALLLATLHRVKWSPRKRNFGPLSENRGGAPRSIRCAVRARFIDTRYL
jgi:NADPH-dependent 2,4-dienoyl-CoA reductase/sulfur reductase-like enzyme